MTYLTLYKRGFFLKILFLVLHIIFFFKKKKFDQVKKGQKDGAQFLKLKFVGQMLIEEGLVLTD